jgi:hypothetical protein
MAMDGLIRAALRNAAGACGLLVALALLLLTAPHRIAPLQTLDTLLLPIANQLRPAAEPSTASAVVRLPTVPAVSAAEQLAAIDRLAQTVPSLRTTLLWLPNAPLQEAVAWSAEGQRLQWALAEAGAHVSAVPLAQVPASAARLGDLLRSLSRNAAGTPPAAVALAKPTATGVEALPLLQALQGTADLDLTWVQGSGLLVGDRLLTGPDGYVYPAVAAGSVRRELQLAALPAELPPVVVIGAADDPALDVAASTLSALARSAYSYSPWWSPALDRTLVLVLLIAFLLLLPRLSAGSGLLLTVLLGVAMVGIQLGFQLGHAQWLPLGASYAMLLLGYPLAALASHAAGERRRLLETAETTRLELARYQLRQNELDAARANLLALTGGARLALLYDLAIGYERRRQYPQAQEVLTACARQDKTFRDVRERLAVLSQLVTTTTGRIQPVADARTLVMPQVLEKPLLGRYRLEREIGRGAMGVVYLGVDPKIGRQVAIKTLDMAQLSLDEVQEFKERFFREAEAAGRLSHPGIVTIYDVGEEGDLAFIAMDYAAGQPLSSFLDAARLLPVATVYAIMAQAADALDYAHARGVVHRDIKPANLIYDPASASLKITDFGIARVGDTRRTSTGTVLGSPSYMAPEQIAGGTIEGTADLFSLGVTFFQLLTGRLPFAGGNITQLAYQISQSRHPDPRKLRPELPGSASRIINKALAKRPAGRYQRGAEMAEALRRATPAGKVS